jgi:hypothetical protein
VAGPTGLAEKGTAVLLRRRQLGPVPHPGIGTRLLLPSKESLWVEGGSVASPWNASSTG